MGGVRVTRRNEGCYLRETISNPHFLGMILLAPLLCVQALSLQPVQTSKSFVRRQPAGAQPLVLDEVQNGFGRLLPHAIFELGPNGQPTFSPVEIRTVDDFLENATASNSILPVTIWPANPTLPNGVSGNHYVAARFSDALDLSSVLDSSAAASAVSQLTGAISFVSLDPMTGATTPIQGRAFIGGRTYGALDPLAPGQRVLETWVGLDGNGDPEALDVGGATPGLGFPGTENSAFAFAGELVADDVFVFVVDSDGDLSTHEVLPGGTVIQLRITTAVSSVSGRALAEEAIATSHAGVNSIGPEVARVFGVPDTVPADGDVNVDPLTDVEIRFTEAVDPTSLGPLDEAGLSFGVQLFNGPTTASVALALRVRPKGAFDFTRMVLEPASPFWSASSDSCGFGTAEIRVAQGFVRDPAGNANDFAASAFFDVGGGAELVNAPVTPDAIYVARGGANVGLSIVDLNGFGAGTGSPDYDVIGGPSEGNSNFPNNPNVSLQGALLCPPLAPGTCNVDGGSSGVFTLTLDTSLDTTLLGPPLVQSVGEVVLGHPLDLVFNAAVPFGCQSGGGNLCANTGLKNVVLYGAGTNTCGPFGAPGQPSIQVGATGNLASWAPHPNPPPLVFPPLCVSPWIGGQEPTSIVSALPVAQGGKGLTNLLVPGDPFGSAPIPPSGLLASEQNAWFVGPSLPQQSIAACVSYMMRQQIGQFLYFADRAAGEVVVVNSNRCTVIDRIEVADPAGLAISPNLDFLAISNQAGNELLFLDVDPSSANFHAIVASVDVGVAPEAVAWESGGEEIFVCNTGDDSISIVSGFDFSLRKTLAGAIGDSGATLGTPVDLVMTPRQSGFGNGRYTYYAWILDDLGQLVLFESGPDGTSGPGYDELVGVAPFTLANAKALQYDQRDLGGAVWVAHEQQLGLDGVPTGLRGGAVTKVRLEAPGFGPELVDPATTPNMRGKALVVELSIGSDQLTGIPVDLAFDDLANLSDLPNATTPFSVGVGPQVNGKSPAKRLGGTTVGVGAPEYLFVAIPDSDEGGGRIDVLRVLGPNTRVDTNPFQPGVNSIAVDGITGLSSYLSQ